MAVVWSWVSCRESRTHRKAPSPSLALLPSMQQIYTWKYVPSTSLPTVGPSCITRSVGLGVSCQTHLCVAFSTFFRSVYSFAGCTMHRMVCLGWGAELCEVSLAEPSLLNPGLWHCGHSEGMSFSYLSQGDLHATLGILDILQVFRKCQVLVFVMNQPVTWEVDKATLESGPAGRISCVELCVGECWCCQHRLTQCPLFPDSHPSSHPAASVPGQGQAWRAVGGCC